MAKFVKVKCKCGAERVVFDHSSRKITCESCGEVLVAPTGGKSVVFGESEEELG